MDANTKEVLLAVVTLFASGLNVFAALYVGRKLNIERQRSKSSESTPGKLKSKS